VQMGGIENKASQFADQDITVLPIVMNTEGEIAHDMNSTASSPVPSRRGPQPGSTPSCRS